MAGTKTDNVVLIPLDDLQELPRGLVNIRGGNRGDMLGDITALRESIRSIGIQQPIKVLKIGDNYYPVIGFRRIAACHELVKEGYTEYQNIPAIVTESNDDSFEADWLFINLAGDTGVEEVSQYAVALRVFQLSGMSYDAATIAKRTGMSQRTVRDMIQTIRDCTKKVNAAGLRGIINLTAARLLRSLPEDEQDRIITEVLQGASMDGLTRSERVVAQRENTKAIRVLVDAWKEEQDKKAKELENKASDILTPPDDPEPEMPLAAPESPPEPKDDASEGKDKAKRSSGLEKRLALLQDMIDYYYDGGDELILMKSVNFDASQYNEEGAVYYAILHGMALAADYLQGLSCEQCGKPWVSEPTKTRLPMRHHCES